MAFPARAVRLLDHLRLILRGPSASDSVSSSSSCSSSTSLDFLFIFWLDLDPSSDLARLAVAGVGEMALNCFDELEIADLALGELKLDSLDWLVLEGLRAVDADLDRGACWQASFRRPRARRRGS